MAIVVNAINGIEHGTRRMMMHARERGLARVLVINKIDFDGADLAALVDALREEFGSECLPVNLPAGRGSTRAATASSTTRATPISRRWPKRTSASSTRWWRSTKP